MTMTEETSLSVCDGCGAHVPIDQLSIVTFIEGEGFACEECKRDTVVVTNDNTHDLEGHIVMDLQALSALERLFKHSTTEAGRAILERHLDDLWRARANIIDITRLVGRQEAA